MLQAHARYLPLALAPADAPLSREFANSRELAARSSRGAPAVVRARVLQPRDALEAFVPDACAGRASFSMGGLVGSIEVYLVA